MDEIDYTQPEKPSNSISHRILFAPEYHFVYFGGKE